MLKDHTISYQSTPNLSKCIRVIFDNTDSARAKENFKLQLQQLVTLAELLNRPALFIYDTSQPICGLVRGKHVLIIGDLGKLGNAALEQLKQEKIINQVYIPHDDQHNPVNFAKQILATVTAEELDEYLKELFRNTISFETLLKVKLDPLLSEVTNFENNKPFADAECAQILFTMLVYDKGTPTETLAASAKLALALNSAEKPSKVVTLKQRRLIKQTQEATAVQLNAGLIDLLKKQIANYDIPGFNSCLSEVTLDVADALLKHTDSKGQNLLHYLAVISATTNSNNRGVIVKFAKLLLEQGVDPNQTDNDGNTMLHLLAQQTVEQCNMPLLSLLLGVLPNQVTPTKAKTPSFFADDAEQRPLINDTGSSSQQEYNINVNITNKAGKSPLDYAILAINEALISALINKGASLNRNQTQDPLYFDSSSSTEYARRVNSVYVANIRKLENILQLKLTNDQALHQATWGSSWSRNCDAKAIKSLILSKNASIDSKDENGDTPLYPTKGLTDVGFAYRAESVLLFALTRIANEIKKKEKKGEKSDIISYGLATGSAVFQAWQAIKKSITGNKSFDLNTVVSTMKNVRIHDFLNHVDAAGNSLLHYAALANNLDAVNQLIQEAENSTMVNRRNTAGETALHLAAKPMYKQIIFALIAAGADFSLKNNEKETVLFIDASSYKDFAYRLDILMEAILKNLEERTVAFLKPKKTIPKPIIIKEDAPPTAPQKKRKEEARPTPNLNSSPEQVELEVTASSSKSVEPKVAVVATVPETTPATGPSRRLSSAVKSPSIASLDDVQKHGAIIFGAEKFKLVKMLSELKFDSRSPSDVLRNYLVFQLMLRKNDKTIGQIMKETKLFVEEKDFQTFLDAEPGLQTIIDDNTENTDEISGTSFLSKPEATQFCKIRDLKLFLPQDNSAHNVFVKINNNKDDQSFLAAEVSKAEAEYKNNVLQKLEAKRPRISSGLNK